VIGSIGRLGVVIAAIGIVCGATSSHAQVEPIVHAQVGLVEFLVPKEFVTNWVRSRQHLGVEFSYPGIDPLGRFRFGDENRQKWIDYQRSLIKRGENILNVTLDPILKPPPYTKAEKKHLVNSICTGFAGGRIESYSAFDVDFWKCVRGDEIVAHRGEHRPTGLQFAWERKLRTWRITMINLEDRIRTTLHIGQESLKDWKAIIMSARATIDAWRQ
jgi:hypothetical protein